MDHTEENYTDEEFEEYRERLVMTLVALACYIVIDYGNQRVMEILDGHPTRSHELFRMEKHVFFRLVKQLKDRNLLKDTRGVCVEEQLAIFLITLGHNERNRKVQEEFQHSGETISRHFNNVLKAIATFSMSIIVPPSFDRVPDRIRENPRFWPFFKGCIGAIDGTHIEAIIPVGEQLAYRGRKGRCTQNIMAACSFDMLFTFVWAGWEGSAHDSRILSEAIHHPNLNFPKPPNGKYYLVDAGYPNMPGYLGPFKKTRYHVPAFQNGNLPNGVKEHFNRRHSSLRNVIERCFGVWKSRWPILKCMPPYPFETQRLIVVASMALHNFIRQEAIYNTEFEKYNNDEEYVELEEDTESEDDSSDEEEGTQMDDVRVAIANAIFTS